MDGLARLHPYVCARWVREKQTWPDVPKNAAINQFVSTLSDAQREVLAQLLDDARDGGIHDALVFLNDRINLDGLRLTVNGRELPVMPFDSELYYDWTGRREGYPWPDEDPEQGWANPSDRAD